MRRLVLSLGIVLAVALGYAALPYYWAAQLRKAVETSDVALLNQTVDWVAVRASVKDMVMGEVMKDMGQGSQMPSGGQMLGAGLAAVLADKMIEAMLTPAGLAQLMKSGNSGQPPKLRDDMIRRMGLVSPTRFEIEIVTPGDNKRVLGVMQPYGIQWKLNHVALLP